MTAFASLCHADETSFYSLAMEYLQAAEILVDTPATKINVSLVTIYLLGHAAELFMKSCLYKSGVPLRELKIDIGHDLEVLVAKVQAVGLHPPLELPYLLSLSRSYKEKSTEYRQLKAMSLPPTDLLLHEVRMLSSRTFNQVANRLSEA